jgi:Na+-translocating ferredoxin:NAD+ oxidoreductase RnfD subunit
MFAYGIIIGVLIVLLRWKGIFVAATTFAVLSGNMLSPLLDMGVKAWKDRRRPATGEAG